MIRIAAFMLFGFGVLKENVRSLFVSFAINAVSSLSLPLILSLDTATIRFLHVFGGAHDLA